MVFAIHSVHIREEAQNIAARRQCRRPGFNSWVRKIPWRRKWQPTPVFLPGESHGRRNLVGYISPWGHKESDTTERLYLLTYLFKRDWKGSRPSLDGMSVPSSRLLSLEPEALNTFLKIRFGLPDSSIGKESLCSAGDPGLIPGLGRFTGEGKGYPLQSSWASLVAHLVKNLPAVWETWVRPLGWEDPLEKGKINHSCCSHVFQEANSLRRTMQIVECSLLHRRAQGRVCSEPRP